MRLLDRERFDVCRLNRGALASQPQADRPDLREQLAKGRLELLRWEAYLLAEPAPVLLGALRLSICMVIRGNIAK